VNIGSSYKRHQAIRFLHAYIMLLSARRPDVSAMLWMPKRREMSLCFDHLILSSRVPLPESVQTRHHTQPKVLLQMHP
jgi:hypothetical protein